MPDKRKPFDGKGVRIDWLTVVVELNKKVGYLLRSDKRPHNGNSVAIEATHLSAYALGSSRPCKVQVL